MLDLIQPIKCNFQDRAGSRSLARVTTQLAWRLRPHPDVQNGSLQARHGQAVSPNPSPSVSVHRTTRAEEAEEEETEARRGRKTALRRGSAVTVGSSVNG